MSDVRKPVIDVLDSVVDAATGRAGALTSFAALLVASFLLTARLLTGHRYVALGLRIAGLVTALWALTLGIKSQGWVSRVDAATTYWLAEHRSFGFDVAATVITDFGSPLATAAAGAVCAAVLSWLARSMVPGIVIAGTVGGAAAATTALKAIVGRPRPPLQWQAVLETDPSFPSGHVTGTAALLGIVAFVVGMGQARTTRVWLTIGVVIGVALVAATRVYLGVHWLTDVIAGAIVAALFVSIGAAVLDAQSHRRDDPTGRGTASIHTSGRRISAAALAGRQDASPSVIPFESVNHIPGRTR
jgi:undecaprenyl-diphosphatase